MYNSRHPKAALFIIVSLTNGSMQRSSGLKINACWSVSASAAADIYGPCRSVRVSWLRDPLEWLRSLMEVCSVSIVTDIERASLRRA